ncbi:hypothetical protein ACA910_018798 [Epithemia clementina (nom. ined.)]
MIPTEATNSGFHSAGLQRVRIVSLLFIVIIFSVFDCINTGLELSRSFVSTTNSKELSMDSPSLSPIKKIIGVYICHDFSYEEQQRKINELYSYFGDNFVIVTDRDRAEFGSLQGLHVPLKQIVGMHTGQNITPSHRFTFDTDCCGLELTMMWLIDHATEYDYAWVMEDDVYWTNMTEFANFMSSFDDDDTDLLHQNQGTEQHPFTDKKYWNFRYLSPPYVQPTAALAPPYYFAWFHLYRISPRVAKRVNEWRLNKNDGHWTFYEPLVATLAIQDPDLVTKSHLDNKLGYEVNMAWKPCFQYHDIYGEKSLYSNGGVFHPVKKDFKECKGYPKLD